jgi:hypothetical protein
MSLSNIHDCKLARSTIVDLIASHLQAMSAITKSTDIVDIEFGAMAGNTIPMKLITKKQEVQVIVHNGN